VRVSEFVEAVFQIKGKPPDFTSFRPHREIYDSLVHREIVLKCARQVGKSIFEALGLCVLTHTIPRFNALHVSPLEIQMSRFVKDKLNPTLDNPLSKKLLIGRGNEYYKEFRNGSKIFLSYAQTNADRVRGISADTVMYDEIQDIVWDVVPVVNECLAESSFMKKIYAGTPKTMDNPIEFLWSRSKQYEWAVKCEACGYTNVPHDGDEMEKMIGRDGPVCARCKKSIDPWQGRWLSVNPNGKYEGFHIPRIMIKSRDERKRKLQWEDVLEKYETYPKEQFYNEVLGVSVPVGGQPISVADVEACTGDYYMFTEKRPEAGVRRVVLGVDWGIMAQNSFTVVCVGGFTEEGKFRVLFAKRFASTDLLAQVDEIAEIGRRFGAVYVGADFGVGATNNALLQEKLPQSRVLNFLYVNSKDVFKPGKGKYHVDRTWAIDQVVVAFRKRRIELPRDLGPLKKDLLALREEQSRSGRKIYNHNPSEPDDFLHALTFAYLTALLDAKHAGLRPGFLKADPFV